MWFWDRTLLLLEGSETSEEKYVFASQFTYHSHAMVLTKVYGCILVFLEERFQLRAPYQYGEMIRNANIILRLLKIIQ